MNLEVEIRVRIKDLEKAKEKLNFAGKYIKTRFQKDYYFHPKDNDYFKDLGNTIEFLRLRDEEDNLCLSYSYVRLDENGKKISTEEYDVKIDNVDRMREILEKIGMIMKVVVSKKRHYYEISDFEVVLDEIEGLGNFMEIEIKSEFEDEQNAIQECYELLKKLGIEYSKAPDMGYPDMVLLKKKES